MSSTIPQTPPPTVRDQLFAQATSFPNFLARAETADPTLAAAIKGQAQTVTMTPIGGLVVAALGAVSAHYGLGWGESVDAEIAGLLFLIGGYVTHYVQALIGQRKIANAPAATTSAAPLA